MMKRWLGYFVTACLLMLCGMGFAAAQKGPLVGKEPRPGNVVVPPSNVVPRKERGKRAHTNFLIFVPGARSGQKPSPLASSGPYGETPSSLGCVYQTGPTPTPGCPITSTNYDNPVGGSHVIAIVDAYDYPTAASDFQTFSQQFGLPYGNACGANGTSACLSVVYASGSKPQGNCSWNQEAALDIEWAHAMAPKAQIILVEAASASFSDLFQAVSKANTLVSNAGGGQVSMSWGGGEFSSESVYDTYFSTAGVTYFASSGDTGGVVIYPSASPDVISAGGTTVNRDSSGNFTGESAWGSAGGGPSAYEPAPDYQGAIYTLAQMLNGYRGTPDFSFDANPASGVSVYDSTSCQGYVGWMVFGGTSVASPSLSGIFNLSGDFDGGWDSGTNTSSVQNHLYQNYNTASSGGTVCQYQSPFYDVTSGSAGSFPTGACWDFATGIGSDRGVSGLTASAGFSLSSSPSSQTVNQGSNTSYTVDVSYSGGFSGTVDLSASGLPSGASASFSPTSVTSTGSSTMSVTTSSSTPAGTYTLTVTGTSGSLTQTTSLTLVVASAASPDFSISASPSSQTVNQGSSTSYSVGVSASGGFASSVGLSASGLPTGAIASFSPTSVSGSGSSTMAVSTSGSTPAGTYTLTITGTSGSLTHSTTVSLVVKSSGSSGSFSLAAASGTITVAVNSSSSDTITVTPSGGFTGSVSLSLSGLPHRTNSSFTVNPVSITGSSSASSILTIGTNKRTTTGSYSLTLTATSGSLTQSIPLTLVVGSTSSPDFSISASPSSQTVSPGSSTSYTVGVSATGGFTGSVGFSVSGLPSGASASFSPTSVSGSGSSTMTVATGTSTPTGTYSITITGTSGSLTHAAVVTLVVGTAAGGDFSLSASPGNVTLRGGGTATYSVTVTPASGSNPTVGFQVSGAPSGSSSTFSPSTVTGSGSTTLSVIVPSGTKGSYTLTITGTNTLGTSHSVTVGLKAH